MLPVLTLLALLRALAERLFHLFLELFRFAPQHFLLPFLLGGLLGVALLARQILLTLGELIELLERVFNFLLFAIGARGGALLLRLVLVLFRIELEIEKLGEIARGASASTAATAAASEGDLDLAEGGFGAQQILQRLLLVRNRVLELLLLQLLRGRGHGLRSRDHILLKIADGRDFVGQLASLQTPRESDRLIAEGRLGLRKEF